MGALQLRSFLLLMLWELLFLISLPVSEITDDTLKRILPSFAALFLLWCRIFFIVSMMLSNWHDSMITWAVNRNYYAQETLQRGPGVTNYYISPVSLFLYLLFTFT